MKKFLAVCFALIIALCLCGCGTFTPASNNPNGSNPNGGDDNPPEQTAYTVTLTLHGEPFELKENISARWTEMKEGSVNSNFMVEAPFDENGVATAEGLEGNYAVTLSAPPSGYIYNPNDIRYTASRRNPTVTIELEELLYTVGSGADFYGNSVQITKSGYYGLQFTQAGQELRCTLSPGESGKYVIESIVDTTANVVNPRIDIYGSNPAFTPRDPYESLNTGGISALYTKNFRYVFDNPSGDKGLLHFIVKCDSRVDYPVTVYFYVGPGGESGFVTGVSMAVPKALTNEDGTIKKSPEASGTVTLFGLGDNGGLLDGTRVELQSDGYYHVIKDANGNACDHILYFTPNTRAYNFADSANNTYRIYGIKAKDENGEYIFDSNGNPVVENKCYLFFLLGYNAVRTIAENNPENILPQEYKNYRDLQDKVSYYDCRNSRGYYAVTEELKEFLVNFAANRSFFFDGNGTAEAMGYKSSDENQWLCFCSYFR